MGDITEARASLYSRLAARRLEIERAILARVADVRGEGESQLVDLPESVSAGVGHGLAGVRRGEDEAGPIPNALLAFAHRSAREGIAVDIVVRSYFVGYAMFCGYILQEAEADIALRRLCLHDVLRAEAALFEHVLGAVAGEYARERRSLPRPLGARQLACVKSLLEGERVDTADLAYETRDWNLGAIVIGDAGPPLIRDLARSADCRLLIVRPEVDVSWVWFGSRHRCRLDELSDRATAYARGTLIALGETLREQAGWRLSHQQAEAALQVADHGGEGVVRYADVGLLASISRDRVLTNSLQQMYLAPLSDARDGGSGLRETLRAYFAAGRNVTSAAAALGVSRQTVGRRLQVTETKLGRKIEDCAPELEMALRLDGVDMPRSDLPSGDGVSDRGRLVDLLS